MKWSFLESSSAELHKPLLDKLKSDFIKVYLKISDTKITIDDVFEDGTTYWTVITEGESTGRPFRESTVELDLRIYEAEQEVYHNDHLVVDLYKYDLPKLIRKIVYELRDGEEVEVKSNRVHQMEAYFNKEQFP